MTEGNEYRMPTKDQVNELWDNTTHTCDPVMNSIVFTDDRGSVIIFPCSGCWGEMGVCSNPLGIIGDDVCVGAGFGLWAIDGCGTDGPSSINGFDYYGEFASITCLDGVNVELERIKDGGAYRGLTVRPVSLREDHNL